MNWQNISVPSLVRVKPGALDRVGLYLARANLGRAAVMVSAGLVARLLERLRASLTGHSVTVMQTAEIEDATFEQALERFTHLPPGCQAVIGLGGGRALDTAKYAAFLANLPYYAVPTSLSNDGFCSPQSSLTLQGKKRSLPARLPAAVVIDTDVCLQAPKALWWSGIGDLVAKITAVMDWKLAFHQRGQPVHDLAALLAESSVYQFMARPQHDLEGMRLLGSSLMLNGIAMELSGSSRAASGSEHLISHALDRIATRPRLHGLQVGVASYLVSRLHGQATDRIATLLDQTEFWQAIQDDPFSRRQWLQALQLAPAVKDDFFTILSTRDCTPEVERMLSADPRLAPCFVD